MYLFACIWHIPEHRVVLLVVIYIYVHVLPLGTCPNCTLYPMVTTSLPKIFKLLCTFLYHCRIREHSIDFFFFILFNGKSIFKARIGKLNYSEPMNYFLLLPCAIIS